jgi:hypothetical protein
VSARLVFRGAVVGSVGYEYSQDWPDLLKVETLADLYIAYEKLSPGLVSYKVTT